MSTSAVPPTPSPDDALDSPVFQRPDAITPRVHQPDSPWSLVLGLVGALVLGVVAMERLSAARQAHLAARSTPVRPTAAPAPAGPPPPHSMSINHFQPAMTAPVPVPQSSAFPPVSAAADTEARRLRAPVMVVDLSDNAPARAVVGDRVPGQDDTSRSAEERFAARVASGGVETSHATRLQDLTRVIPQGTVIPAVLETAINSDLPGSSRAVVSRDVRSFDGSQVLIPRGSTLIGQYRNGVAYGQHRAFVIWSRILTPDGISIDIGSPGADPLGRGGLSGETNSHFFQRFGSSILLSVLSAGVAAVSRGSSDTAIIIGSPLQAQALAAQGPQKTDIPVTVKVMQGTPMSVFLTRDLDFSGVVGAQ